MTKLELRDIPAAEWALIRALNTCTFLPGSYEKRFVRDMFGAKQITQKQLLYLYRTAHRYRRQLVAGKVADLWKLIADGKYPRWEELESAALCTCGHKEHEHGAEDECTVTGCACDNFRPVSSAYTPLFGERRP